MKFAESYVTGHYDLVHTMSLGSANVVVRRAKLKSRKYIKLMDVASRLD